MTYPRSSFNIPVNNFDYSNADVNISPRVNTKDWSSKYKEIGSPKQKKESSPAISNTIDVFKVTIGLNHHFKFTITDLQVNKNFKLYGKSDYGEFLPVESLSITPLAIETKKLSIGAFSDLPLINKRRMGSLKVTLLDDKDSTYENKLYEWFGSTVGSDGYVKPLMSVIKQADYYEYDNSGKLSKHYIFSVMPEGEISLERNYSDNSFKKINFSLLVISTLEEVAKGYDYDISEMLLYTNKAESPLSSEAEKAQENTAKNTALPPSTRSEVIAASEA